MFLSTSLLQTTTAAASTPPSTSWILSNSARILVALALLAVGVYVSKLAVRLLGRPVARRFARQSVAQTVLHGVRATIVILTGVVAAGVVGVELGNIVLSVTVFSAVLGIVLAPIVGSVINGLFVLADQPYEIGDMIELDDGTRGFVEDLTLRYTKIITLENTVIVLPNGSIRQQTVTNYSAEDKRTRLSLPILITYESNTEQARRLFEQAAGQCEDVVEGGPDIRIGSARYPAKPTTFIDEYGDHGVLITLRYWVERPYKLLTVRSRVQERLWSLLDDQNADVEFAYPHQHLIFDETSGEANVAVRRSTDDSGAKRMETFSPSPDRTRDASGREPSGRRDE